MSNSNDGDSDDDVSITTTNTAINDAGFDGAVNSTLFEEGEKVLVYHGPCLYEAKVQKVEGFMDKRRYFVHYSGWNKHWDEWLSVERLLKRTEENLQKQKALKEMHAVEKNAKPCNIPQDKPKTSTAGVRGRRRKNEVVEKECAAPLENIVNIQIPPTLKKQLVDDYACITHLGQLVKLPRSPSVYDILDKYFEFRVKKDGMITETVAEVNMGLRIYFDKALPAMLLYNNERQQYKAAIGDNVSPSGIYGAEHFLRLFVKLPELLNSLNVETETMTQLQQRLQEILRFLQSNQSAFFLSNYEAQEEVDDDVKEEDD